MPQLYALGGTSTSNRDISASQSNFPVCQFITTGANQRLSLLSFWVSFEKHLSYDWFTHDDAPVKVRLVRVDDSNGGFATVRNKLDDSISDSPTLTGGQTTGSTWTGTVTDVYAAWYVHPLWTPYFERTLPPRAPIRIGTSPVPDPIIGIDITTGAKGVDVRAGGIVEIY